MSATTTHGADALLRAGATDQAGALRRGEVAPVALARAALDRIAATDPGCNAISWLRADEALAEAAALDPGSDPRPFAGVPILLKDHRCLAPGQETRFGTTALAAARRPWTVGTNVHRSLADLGYVVLGRTTTPEFATALLTESVATGVTRNPALPSHTSGGSSGGAASAVAAGMVAVAHATDGGGSIRVPAACVGIVGLKPSRGRVSMGPDGGESWAGATVEGVLTRTVADAAAVTAGMSRWFPGDPGTAPGVVPGVPGAAPGDLRIGVMGAGPDGAAWHPEVERVLRATASALSGRGHRVSDDHPAALDEAEELGRHYDLMISVDVELLAKKVERQLDRDLRADELAPRNAARRRTARGTGASAYLRSRYWLGSWGYRVQSWWEEHDVLLLPTLGGLPPTAATDADLADAATLDASMAERTAAMRPMTNFFNVAGLPAISVPVGRSADGVPIGMQLVARFGDEATLLALAADLEERGPWAVAEPS